ncbi:IclR family transcriptional regulator [Nakamurella endophytica]|uniref:IclR family transcriptional regulator n=1 Tax=Nakamurella endophytica TaxID=1748367 RepID=A0A917T1N7_9ACTN|nr:IclR family transcriptional regulator [Nakamurella endophytica]GGM05842.1 IclR family transcriptional regulator [Nakamurella endophytica]
MGNADGSPASAVQSVDRAVTALEVLARSGTAGVSEVAAALGVHKSTASRLLAALQARELVEVAGERGRYRLGYGVLRLASAMGGRLDVTTQGREVCEELAEELGETVNIAVRQGRTAVNVHQAHGSAAVSVNNWVGRPTPLHATSSGKVLLAFADRGARARTRGTDGPHGPYGPYGAARTGGPAGTTTDLERYTDHTVTDPDLLEAQLERVRVDGYAVTVGEYEVGLNAVAAPVFGADGALVAAVSLSGPSFRLPESRLPEVAPRVVAAAIRVGERMGHLG